MHCKRLVSNVVKMPEPEKRKPISVYLTPKAAMILREYNTGSGYGSLSRTVEEIILAFDSTYKLVKESLRTLVTEVKTERVDKGTLWAIMVATLWNMDNTISRLNKESPLP